MDTIIDRIYVGVDVSKGWIDVSHPSRGDWRVGQPAGLAAFAAEMAAEGAVVVMEATGRHDAALRQALGRAGAAHVRLTPQAPRRMAQVLGVRAKSDKADARLIRRFGEVFRPAPAPEPDQARAATSHAIQQLVAHRRALVACRSAQQTRLGEATHPEVMASLAALCDRLGAEIATFDALIAATIAADPALAARSARLQSAPGIGPVIAASLIADLPELGHLDRHRIAALAGLCPWDNDSGTRRGCRTIRGGRPQVRRLLYIAGLHASRGNGPLKPHRDALIARGKHVKAAITACARKLLTILNAMLKTGTDFRMQAR